MGRPAGRHAESRPALLAGVPAAEAVAWVRAAYRPEAVETSDHEAWVGGFAEWESTHARDGSVKMGQ